MNRYDKFRFLSRCYLDIQQLRTAAGARLRMLRKEKAPPETMAIMLAHYRHLIAEERAFLKEHAAEIEFDPLWEWCEATKGLGHVAALTFMGFINPEIATTAGKAKAYLGLFPGARLRSGEKAAWNPHGKGRVWFVVQNVIRARDSYYPPLYRAKKIYYMEQPRVELLPGGVKVKWPPFQDILDDPERCPRFEDCLKRLKDKAKRLGREIKKLPCKGHVDNMAKRWLAALLVSHATENMRRACDLSTDSFKSHRGYIPPKSHKDETPPQDVTTQIAGRPMSHEELFPPKKPDLQENQNTEQAGRNREP